MTHRIIKPLVLFALFLSTIFFIYEINFISRDSNILGGNLFLTHTIFDKRKNSTITFDFIHCYKIFTENMNLI